MSACVCMHHVCLCAVLYVCIRGSPLSETIKGKNMFELIPSPPHPQGSNAWMGLYTIHKDHYVGEKWAHYCQAVMVGYICFVALSVE